jgi:hypothetical protein
MTQTNREIFQDRIAGTTANDIGGAATVAGMFDGQWIERIATTAANGSIAATKFWSNPLPFPVVATFWLNCDSAVAFNATNYATHTISVDDGADTSPVTAATFLTNAVNYAADIDVTASTSNTANCVVAAGANVFYAVTQAAAGVSLPVRVLKMKFHRK